ncbi:hypothetical protein A5886_002315 [Enterococcus sp. 8G7_MSG3316]|uniref:Acetyltransferase n=1 Tax=Candidatus Enterococcus testudinis TaxID=1834191 RepID=A0A242A857_9ENTE|nr:sugar O-acetyltransferase [Enterococcus sp. 8G7_MSG3316]OTN77218.1 hypothetical protein A5886_002315 [Enterococcus sp. 8G7_MSG3316]
MNLEEIKERMHNGSIYYENAAIGKEQKKYNELLYDFNQVRPSDEEAKQEILTQLLGALGKNVYIEAPLRANWGANTYIGDRFYANFNLTLVDDTRIEIGDDVMIGPNVTLTAGTHPLDPALRLRKAQNNLPVVIEDNVWIGAGSIVLPGVTIGKNTVIGAGSLVTKDIPANCVAFGSPCVVTKQL